MKFDESVGALVAACLSASAPLDERTTIIRDGAGRLLYARESINPSRNELERVLRSALGGYAAPTCVVDGRSAVALVSDRARRRTLVLVGSEEISINYLDRRIVGSDWLAPLEEVSKGAPRLVFGSLKGGVGRTTALSVLAADLARNGKKVLVIDLDLEAPGLGFVLLPSSRDPAEDRRPRYGVIDYLVETPICAISDEELTDFVGVSPFVEGSIDVVPAVGRVTDTYPATMMEKLSRALVEDVTDGRLSRVVDQIGGMVSRFETIREYDAVLIDARAGMGELSAAPFGGLGAEIFLFGVDQPQTFRGYRYLLANLVQAWGVPRLGEPDWRERISFVHAKAPSSATKREAFRQRLYDLCAELLYDAEELRPDGTVQFADFNPSPHSVGPGVPHDATFIEWNPNYDAFDPTSDGTQLDPDVYRSPYSTFLARAWTALGLTRGDNEL